MRTIDRVLLKKNLVLDGALGTELETLIPNDSDIQPKNNKLWSTIVLLRKPTLIKRVHKKYLESGSDIILTSTYQASNETLSKYGGFGEDQINRIWNLSVNLANLAIQEYKSTHKDGRIANANPILAGSVGPYGAFLANGAEYTGEYGTIRSIDLENFHKPQLYFFFKNPKVPLVAIETIPNYVELKSIVNLVLKLLFNVNAGMKVYITFSFKDANHISDGTPIEKVFHYLNMKIMENPILKKSLVAIGCNCVTSDLVSSIIVNMKQFNEHQIPLIVYPNLGFVYSSKFEDYESYRDTDKWSKSVSEWLSKGVKIIGGCCSTGPSEIQEIRKKCDMFDR